MADMEVDPPETSKEKGKKDSGKKRFEVKKVRWLFACRYCVRRSQTRDLYVVERSGPMGLGYGG